MLELFQHSGVVGYPLIICSIFALGIILERVWALTRLQKLENDAFESLKGTNDTSALSRAEIVDAPCARIVHSLLPLRGSSENTIAQAADIALALQRLRLRKFLGTLATIGSTAPFVGLFGTVLGVMLAFKGMSQSGLSSDVMAGGISEALSATALGLLVAIPSIVAYNFFVGRIAAMLLTIQSHVALLSPMLTPSRDEVRP